ncbi:hypothetical protein JOD55_000835 [Arcanobacterium pluranimalium]|nr:hypothetical protein [Arcanobacterium pluranimalium]
MAIGNGVTVARLHMVTELLPKGVAVEIKGTALEIIGMAVEIIGAAAILRFLRSPT